MRRPHVGPGLVVLLVAPAFGECLSGSTPPLDLLLPWNLAFMAALYGSGALLCREVVRRCGLGLLGLVLLGAAYGVYEEALIDRYWFYRGFWHDAGIGSYSAVWHTNLLLALHLTAFHTAVSICSSIVVVERLFPTRREQPWAGRWGLGAAAVALFAAVPFLYGPDHYPGAARMLAAGALCLLLVGAAFLVPRRDAPAAAEPAQRPRRRLGPIAFTATTAHFVLVYTLPSTGIPWPLGLVVAVAPIGLGIVLVRRRGVGGPRGPDGIRVVTGILAIFVVLDALVGLGGRYDLTLGALAMALLLRRLRPVTPATA